MFLKDISFTPIFRKLNYTYINKNGKCLGLFAHELLLNSSACFPHYVINYKTLLDTKKIHPAFHSNFIFNGSADKKHGNFNRINCSENAHSLKKIALLTFITNFNHLNVFKKYFCALNLRNE